MKKTLLVMGAVLAICSCSNSQKEELGLVNNAPDETLVTTRRPLVIPPEYNLRPAIVATDKDDELSQL